MFTGLIQAIGKIVNIQKMASDMRMSIEPNPSYGTLDIGESIAVNGACLTVEGYRDNIFSVYASKETIERTNLKDLCVGSFVNLERALRLGDRLGGHLVSGHVDCLSQIKEIFQVGNSKRYLVVFPVEFSKYVIEKGSIALDGVSLTVNRCGDSWLEVNIIPETMKNTTILQWKIGSKVNTEFDLIGKYIEKMVLPWKNRGNGQGLSMEFLREHGFF